MTSLAALAQDLDDAVRRCCRQPPGNVANVQSQQLADAQARVELPASHQVIGRPKRRHQLTGLRRRERSRQWFELPQHEQTVVGGC